MKFYEKSFGGGAGYSEVGRRFRMRWRIASELCNQRGWSVCGRRWDAACEVARSVRATYISPSQIRRAPRSQSSRCFSR